MLGHSGRDTLTLPQQARQLHYVTAMRRASSRVGRLVADRRPGSLSKAAMREVIERMPASRRRASYTQLHSVMALSPGSELGLFFGVTSQVICSGRGYRAQPL